MKKAYIILILLFSIHAQADWVQIASFPQVTRITYNGTNIYAGSVKLYVSTNMGTEWSILYNPSIGGVQALNIIENHIWIGSFYNNLYTTNSGVNWINVNLNQWVYWFTTQNSKIFAGTESHGCYISSNYGVNWYPSGYIWDDVMCFLPSGNKLLAGTSQGLYYTTNDGGNWILTLPAIGVYSLISNGPKLFAGSYLGVYNSTNNGDTWEQPNLTINVISLESSAQNIFAGTYNDGFYISNNNGTDWIRKNEGIGIQRINTLTVINNYIFAGTESAGIWKRPLSEIVNVMPINSEIPSKFSLSQNYPNPFNPSTTIRYNLPRSGSVKLAVFDVMGREVETLVNERQAAGSYEATFDGSGFASGVYFYRLTAEGYRETRKMFLVK